MTLAADATMRKTVSASGDSLQSFQVVNADIVYASALVGLALPGHGTPGFIVPYTPTANLCPIGFSVDPAVTGNSSGSPVPEASIDIGGGGMLLTITGLANTVADIGKKVYPVTDNTFALTYGANTINIGHIYRSQSATQAWVQVEPMFKLLNVWDAEEVPTPTPTPSPTPTPTPT